jgi:hypothetical protein
MVSWKIKSRFYKHILQREKKTQSRCHSQESKKKHILKTKKLITYMWIVPKTYKNITANPRRKTPPTIHDK